MKPIKMPRQKRLKELFRYDHKYGLLKWKSTGSGRNSNLIAGCLRSDGYIGVGVDGMKYFAHRIIWVLLYGHDPTEIDHINHVGWDNRLQNLRSVSKAENAKNRKMYIDNTTGVTGVYWNKRNCNWNAKVGVGGKVINLGFFDNFEQAVLAREKAETKYGFHPNHGNSGGIKYGR